MNIPVDQILPNPEQPRKDFDEIEMGNLCASILQNGVVLPIVVEEAGTDRFILHDGERRWRAAKMAGMASVPAVIVPALNGTARQERLVRALVTNIQRADLNPIEEGRSYAELMGMGFTRNQVAMQLGINPARVANCLALLEFEAETQALFASGKLSKDIRLVSALRSIPDAKIRKQTAKMLVEKNITLKGGIETCKRLAETVKTEMIGAGEIPAIRLATKSAGAVARTTWDLFASVGKVPPWIMVEVAARDTCDRCGLRDVASASSCKGCALIEVLKQLIGGTRG